jgi:hypothetical protein
MVVVRRFVYFLYGKRNSKLNNPEKYQDEL